MHVAAARLSSSLALLVLCSPALAADSLEQRIARVEQGLRSGVAIKGQPAQTFTLTDRMAALKVPGVSVAVMNGGVVEWARGYGLAQAGTLTPVTPETLFQAASISKPVAAMGALRMVELGKLALDEDVNLALKAWKLPAGPHSDGQPVTLRRLLNHSAGTSVHGFRGYASGEAVPTLLELLDGASPANSAAVRVTSAPGAQWRYSGGGFSIVQLLMTEASGKPFAPLMKESVLDPIGMKNSTYEQPLPATLHAQAATGHDARGVPVKGKWHTYPEQAAAGLWTTPTDLARFALELHNASAGKSNKVLSKSMAAQMLTRLKGEFGLGITVGGTPEAPSFSHGGSNEGFKTMLFAFTSSGQGAVVMTNGDAGAALGPEILRSVSAEYGWSDFKVSERTVAAVAPELLARYAGTYQMDSVSFIVTAVGTRLFVQAAPIGPEKMELFASSPNSFFNLRDKAEFSFEADATGALELVVKAGRTMRAKKVN